MPTRPHQSLVVKRRWQHLLKQVHQAEKIELDVRPGILAVRYKALIQGRGGCANIGLGYQAALNLQQRVGLLATGCHNAARAV